MTRHCIPGVLLLALLLIGQGVAAQPAQRLSPADSELPEGHGAVLIAISQTAAIVGADTFLFRRLEDNKVFTLQRAFSLLLDGSPSRRVFLLPQGTYYFQRVVGVELEGDYLGVSTKEQSFAVQAGHINYIGQWTINRPRDGGVFIGYPPSSIRYLYEIYPGLVNRYPVTISAPEEGEQGQPD